MTHKNCSFKPYHAYYLTGLLVLLSLFLVSILGFYLIKTINQPQKVQKVPVKEICRSNNDCVNFCEKNNCIIPSCTKTLVNSQGTCSCLDVCGI
jgi:hypothetical protein